jgi:hypothetical protein
LTSKQRRRTERKVRNARASVGAARDAVRQVEATDPTAPEIDPASELFFEFAAPILMTARDQEEFSTAAELAEFIWTATHFDAATQAILLDDFIQQTQVPPHLIPWLLDVYGELAARKIALVGA